MNDVIRRLYSVIEERKTNPEEGSYTCYLFDKGIDKILKKVGEESTEVVIAAKNPDNKLLSEEIADLTYHVLVLCAQRGITMDDIEAVLEERAKVSGNLKPMKTVNKNS